MLSLNDTQTSVLTMVFKYCDDSRLPLLDFPDLRAVLQYLSSDEASRRWRSTAACPSATVGVLLRKMVELESQGAERFFGEPEFDVKDLLQLRPTAAGVVTCLELSDVQDRPLLCSTFMMWMLAELYHNLPEAGDLPKPKLVFFFDEAHLLFDDASKAFLDQIAAGGSADPLERRGRLLRHPDAQGRTRATCSPSWATGSSTPSAPTRPTTIRRCGDRTDVSQDVLLRSRGDADRRSASARRW